MYDKRLLRSATLAHLAPSAQNKIFELASSFHHAIATGAKHAQHWKADGMLVQDKPGSMLSTIPIEPSQQPFGEFLPAPIFYVAPRQLEQVGGRLDDTFERGAGAGKSSFSNHGYRVSCVIVRHAMRICETGHRVIQEFLKGDLAYPNLIAL